MIGRSEAEFSLEKACGLINAMMIVEGNRGHVMLNIDEEKLAFTRDFISKEVARLENAFPSSIDAKVRMAEVELRCLELKPLKLLVSQIDLVISSKDEQRIEAVVRLTGQVRDCLNMLSRKSVADGAVMETRIKKTDRVITSNYIGSGNRNTN